jgi:MoxR-like ATPase
MFLFAIFPTKICLAQLPTGTGKSLMFGLLARYLNLQGQKVAVIVPNEVLTAIQQDIYSPWASKSHSNIFESNAVTINYCTYGDFLTGNIPLATVCLIDEIDSLFFSDVPKLEGDKFISAVLLLNKY